jgi:hypothetical protein
MPKPSTDLDLWREKALASPGSETLTLPVPLHVLHGEAVDVARFFATYWKAKEENGKVVRRGLEMAAGNKKRKSNRLTAKIGDEILSLQRAAVEAGTAYRLVVTPKATNPFDRGQFVLDELTATLEWHFDDGIEDEKDQRLANLDAAHEDDPETADALALALDDYAALAEEHRDEIDGLGDFDATLIDEAKQIAAALRERPAERTGLGEQARDALILRNKIIGLLYQRMALVRAAARFVFRNQPEIVREATSAYERRKRAEAARRAKKKQQEAKPA